MVLVVDGDLGQAGTKHTLNGRVVFIDKVALDQLDGQARLAHATAADDDQLVFAEKLRGLATPWAERRSG